MDDVIDLERVADHVRREALAASRPAVPPPPAEPSDTYAAAILQAKLVSHEDMEIHRREASRAGMKVSDYLLLKHIITRTEYYHAIGLIQRDGIRIAGQHDLPDWNVVLNGRGQPLEAKEGLEDILLLGIAKEIANGVKHLFVLGTEAALSSVRYSAVFTQLTGKGFKVRARLIADKAVIDVVRSEWATRSGAKAKERSSSEQHALWMDIVRRAHEMRASDIHLSAALGRGEIKFRILGDLEVQKYDLTEEDAISLAQSMYNSMVDKGSTSNQFNARIEQDAVITMDLPTGRLRLRYVGFPVEPNGFNVVLRLIPLDEEVKPKSPATLGYSEDQCDLLERIFARSSGLILFVGTTGSGKSTSNANLLMQKAQDNPGKMLRTIEQPVEIRIPGSNVSQTSVLGTDFTDTLRAMMRADPDYLMVGEVRDAETAELILHAVRSGHLCASTLHADGAPIAFDRLAGLGIKRSDLASKGLVAAVIYQRLVPVLCKCCVPATVIASENRPAYVGILKRLRSYLGKDASLEGINFRSEKGCAECNYRGVKDRTVCAEILVPKKAMLPAIAENNSSLLWDLWRSEIDQSRPDVMRGRTAFEHALWKMRQGIVSPKDVEREFTFLDESVTE